MNWVLSEEGVKLAKNLAQNQEISKLDVIYSSLQNKALETAVILAKPHHLPIRTYDDFTELTSITNDFIPNYEETVNRLHKGEIKRINNGETLKEEFTRFSETVERAFMAEEEGNIGIVSHCNILAIYVSHFCNYSSLKLHNIMQMPDIAIMDWNSKEIIKIFKL